MNDNNSDELLVAPRSSPFALVAPRVADADHGNLAGHAWRADIHQLDAGDAVSVTFDQSQWRLHFQYIRIRLLFFFFFET